MVAILPFSGEVEVFILEHGVQHAHSIHRLYECEEFISSVRDTTNSSTHLTVIFWGHGNMIDEQHGYLKIFNRDGVCNSLFINDVLRALRDLAASNLHVNIQFLMTQCWAHCHDSSIYEYSPNLSVDWFTSPNNPETSARRWDSLVTGLEMNQEEFEHFLLDEKNINAIQISTVHQYSSDELKIFLKYLHYSSIHVEATIYISRQRLCT